MQPSPSRDLAVGLFVLVGLCAVAWLSIQVGGLSFSGSNSMSLEASFDQVGALKPRAPVVIAGVEANPGLVLFTMVNDALRQVLQDGCRRLQVPAIPVLDPVIGALAAYLGRESRGLPGKQHLLDSEYFARIDAMTFAINHDDGQSSWGINDADVCLVGVSRTSKTPTCLYLANRGIKAANVPFVPGVELPAELAHAEKPLIVGLTNDPERLIHLRRNRLSMLDHNEATDYTDLEAVRAEVRDARRVFAEHHWPVIDVTRRSIEETASSVYKLLMRRNGGDG
jgi:regulator of PEP synthase PpsR (kinase-PPPase family)